MHVRFEDGHVKCGMCVCTGQPIPLSCAEDFCQLPSAVFGLEKSQRSSQRAVTCSSLLGNHHGLHLLELGLGGVVRDPGALLLLGCGVEALGTLEGLNIEVGSI